jgi:hypothetical protein
MWKLFFCEQVFFVFGLFTRHGLSQLMRIYVQFDSIILAHVDTSCKLVILNICNRDQFLVHDTQVFSSKE